MHTALLTAFPSARVRLNGACRYTPLERLADPARQLIRQCGAVERLAGVLEDRHGTGMSVKAVSADTACLLRHLLRPRKVSELLDEMGVDNGEDAIVALALDDVVELDIGGGYRSGVPLAQRLPGGAHDASDGSALSRLSLRALAYCCSAPFDGAMDLAWRLYYYNRLPVTPSRTARWNEHGGLRLLLTGGNSSRGQALDSDYRCLPVAGGEASWMTWRARHEGPARSRVYKLYVSPLPDAMAACFPAVIDRLLAARPYAFKVGVGAAGLMRPDKFVAYFNEPSQAALCAQPGLSLACAQDVQGVPFSCQLDEHGLMSCGEDPVGSGHLPWHADDSWRIWVCNRLASALDAARRQHAGEADAVKFALLRMRLWGVDPRSWKAMP